MKIAKIVQNLSGNATPSEQAAACSNFNNNNKNISGNQKSPVPYNSFSDLNATISSFGSSNISSNVLPGYTDCAPIENVKSECHADYELVEDVTFGEELKQKLSSHVAKIPNFNNEDDLRDLRSEEGLIMQIFRWAKASFREILLWLGQLPATQAVQKQSYWLLTKSANQIDRIRFCHSKEEFDSCCNLITDWETKWKNMSAEDKMKRKPDASNIVNMMNRKGIIIIIGEYGGIAADLIADVVGTCMSEGVPAKTAREIIEKIANGDELYFVVNPTGESYIQIIVRPAWEDLKDYFEHYLPFADCMGEIKIIYCGHGNEDGSMQIRRLTVPKDDPYNDYETVYGKELKEALCNGIREMSNFCPVDFFFNCCYGAQIAANMLETETDAVTKSIKDFDKVIQQIKNNKTESPFTRVTERTNGLCRAPLEIWENGKLWIKLYPMTDAVQVSTKLQYILGNLKDVNDGGRKYWQEMLKNETNWNAINQLNGKENEKYSTINELLNNNDIFKNLFDKASAAMSRGRWWAPSRAKEDKEAKELVDDCLHVFQARHGDSALLKWAGLTVLIDGGFDGRGEVDPCFWEYVKGLEIIDLVILTHADQDHVNGLLELFRRAQNKTNKPQIGRFITVYVDKNHRKKGTKKTRTWDDLDKILEACRWSLNVVNVALVIDCNVQAPVTI